MDVSEFVDLLKQFNVNVLNRRMDETPMNSWNKAPRQQKTLKRKNGLCYHLKTVFMSGNLTRLCAKRANLLVSQKYALAVNCH